MAEKVCCPGPIGGNNGNSAGGFREAVCVHTKKVYDSCSAENDLSVTIHPKISARK